MFIYQLNSYQTFMYRFQETYCRDSLLFFDVPRETGLLLSFLSNISLSIIAVKCLQELSCEIISAVIPL